MNKKATLIVGGLVAALALAALIGTATVYAQDATPTPQAPTDGFPGGGRGGPGGPGGHQLDGAALEAAAQVLGMTTDEVSAALQEGKSLDYLAGQAGVDLQTLHEAIRAAMPARDGQFPDGKRGLSDAALQAVAGALNMTTDEVSAALQEGKTLEDLATQAGVDIQVIRDAMQSVRTEEIRANIQQALADGSLSQEKADWLLEGLDKGFLTDGGFGFGFHFGGPKAPPTDQPSTNP
jgi:lambda repressor-like predicted transcriptional regulator